MEMERDQVDRFVYFETASWSSPCYTNKFTLVAVQGTVEVEKGFAILKIPITHPFCLLALFTF